MRSYSGYSALFIQLFGIVALLSINMMGCQAISNSGTNSNCSTNGTITIDVNGEGSMSRACGCLEGAGTFSSSSSFNCSILGASTTVYFVFNGITVPHTINVTNVGPTETINPNVSNSTAAITINRTGSFPFSDIATGIGGTFNICINSIADACTQ